MKLVVAYRASEIGEKVLAQAVERARQSAAQVYLVTSLVGGVDTPEEAIEQARTDLDRAAALLAEKRDCRGDASAGARPELRG